MENDTVFKRISIESIGTGFFIGFSWSTWELKLSHIALYFGFFQVVINVNKEIE